LRKSAAEKVFAIAKLFRAEPTKGTSMKKSAILTGFGIAFFSMAAAAYNESDETTHQYLERQRIEGSLQMQPIARQAMVEACPYDRSGKQAFQDFWAQLQLTDGVTREQVAAATVYPAGGRSGSAPSGERLAMADCDRMMNRHN
jgi:hypothetical protein